MLFKTSHSVQLFPHFAMLLICSMMLLAARAKANTIEFDGFQTVGQESEKVIYDSTAHTLQFEVVFGILLNFPAAYLHAPTVDPLTGIADVATTELANIHHFTDRVSGFGTTIDLTLASNFDPAFITAKGGTVAGAEAALISALSSRKAYLSITSTSPEIDRFLVPVPDSASTFSLASIAFVGVLGVGRLFRPSKPALT